MYAFAALPLAPCTAADGDDGAPSVCQLLLAGEYMAALQQPPCRTLLEASVSEAADLAAYHQLIGSRAAAALQAAVRGDGPVEERRQELFAAMLTGVACLHVFMQHNMTGCGEGACACMRNAMQCMPGAWRTIRRALQVHTCRPLCPLAGPVPPEE